MTRRRLLPTFALLVSLAAAAGCSGGGVDARYGKARGESLNGTGAFAELLRKRGHEVRISVKLNDRVGDWADTVVRFAPYPGPPETSEADWYKKWAAEAEGRRIIYIPDDFDAEAEYWDAVIAAPSPEVDRRFVEDARAQRDKAKNWDGELPKPARNPALPADWFLVDASKGPPAVCAKLGGPWGAGIDPKKAALTRHQTLKADHDEDVLLEGDGHPLVMGWAWEEGGDVLAIASGTFLLNEPLVSPERRKLAGHVLDWIGPEPARIAFIEGRASAATSTCWLDGTLWEIFCTEPVNGVLAQWLLFALLLVLSLAPILGRPRAWASSGDDRPSAHAEALGDLLGRVKDRASAQALIDGYHKWRNPGGSGPGAASPHPAPPAPSDRPERRR